MIIPWFGVLIMLLEVSKRISLTWDDWISTDQVAEYASETAPNDLVIGEPPLSEIGRGLEMTLLCLFQVLLLIVMFSCFISEVVFPSRNRSYPKFEHLSGMYRNVSELIIHELGSQEFDNGGYGISIIFYKGDGDGILKSLSRKSYCWFYIRFKNPLFNLMIFPAMHLHLVRGG